MQVKRENSGKNTEREKLREAAEASQTAAKELAKDAALLSSQAAVLKARAAQARIESQKVRAEAQQAGPVLPMDLLLTIPEAAHRLHVAERTLRTLLATPDLQAWLVERTRKVGIYYRFVPLLPPDLVAHLAAQIAAKKTPPR